jgi:HNH endonuclease
MRSLQVLPTKILKRIEFEPNSGCWLWSGNLNWSGYGRIMTNYVSQRTHQVVYEALVGKIPQGLELDHLCRTPCCCNPAHLEPVTRRENIKRGLNWPIPAQAFQRAKTHCPQGHPYDEENTYIHRTATKTMRHCRTCRRLAWHRRKESR